MLRSQMGRPGNPGKDGSSNLPILTKLTYSHLWMAFYLCAKLFVSTSLAQIQFGYSVFNLFLVPNCSLLNC